MGDPVFTSARGKPHWQVLGLVRSWITRGKVEVIPLQEIFRHLPSEAGTWGLHAPGLCDPMERGSVPGVSKTFKQLFEPVMKRIFLATDLEQIKKILQNEWPALHSYLTKPGIEQYFFNPGLSENDQFAQFLNSIAAFMKNEAQPLSRAVVPQPVARIRTSVPGVAKERGWAVAVAYKKDVLLMLTANHLVKPVKGKEREIKVYLPALQGLPLEAKRVPLVDEKLDLAVIAIRADEKLREKIFGAYQIACPEDLSGSVEVAVNASFWQRKRQKGSIVNNNGLGTLRVAGLNVTEGFSGGALFKNGNQIAGILTKDQGRGRDSLAVSIHSGLRLVRFAKLGFLPAVCTPQTLEEQMPAKIAQSIVGKSQLLSPNKRLLTDLFGPDDAARIRVDELPLIKSEMEVKEMKAEYRDGFTKNPSLMADLLIADFTRRTETRCVTLVGHNKEVDTSAYAPSGPSQTAVGCDFPLSITGSPLPLLKDDLQVTMCGAYFRDDNDSIGFTFLLKNQFWDATFIGKCRDIKFQWYVPSGWVREMAAKESIPNKLISIAAGPFQMGGCEEEKPTEPGLWALQCGGWGPRGPTFQAITPAYRIQRFPVTTADYARCVNSGKCNYQLPAPDLGRIRKSQCNWGQIGRKNHPMNCITWNNATEYCAAMKGRLPNEKEWEKAARGTDGRSYPWGRDLKLDNFLSGFQTMEVGLAPELTSPYGLEDIIWHIDEWTSERRYEPYTPGLTGEYLLGEFYSSFRVLRGISNTYHREATSANTQREYIGFRCVFPS